MSRGAMAKYTVRTITVLPTEETEALREEKLI